MRGHARGRAVAGVLAGALLLAACGAATKHHGPHRVTIGVARSTGKHASVTAEGIAQSPVAVTIRASAAPKQRVVVTWGLSCPKTAGGRSNGTGGTYVTRPPNVRPLDLPRRPSAFCAVHAQARLAHSGRVKVTLVASER